jgi:hypothetical protein
MPPLKSARALKKSGAVPFARSPGATPDRNRSSTSIDRRGPGTPDRMPIVPMTMPPKRTRQFSWRAWGSRRRVKADMPDHPADPAPREAGRVVVRVAPSAETARRSRACRDLPEIKP